MGWLQTAAVRAVEETNNYQESLARRGSQPAQACWRVLEVRTEGVHGSRHPNNKKDNKDSDKHKVRLKQVIFLLMHNIVLSRQVLLQWALRRMFMRVVHLSSSSLASEQPNNVSTLYHLKILPVSNNAKCDF